MYNGRACNIFFKARNLSKLGIFPSPTQFIGRGSSEFFQVPRTALSSMGGGGGVLVDIEIKRGGSAMTWNMSIQSTISKWQ